MKRTILTSVSFAALLAAAPALAQDNGSTVTQTGAFNKADVQQNGSNGKSKVDQSGNGVDAANANEVLVKQSGNSAESEVYQMVGDRNDVEVIQNGDSYSYISQTGKAQEAEVRQAGDGNR